jgi:hypothetical protein
MSTLMVPNVLTLEQSRYARKHLPDLQNFLKTEYGEHHNFKVYVRARPPKQPGENPIRSNGWQQGNDRIHFQTPKEPMNEVWHTQSAFGEARLTFLDLGNERVSDLLASASAKLSQVMAGRVTKPKSDRRLIKVLPD